MTLDLGTVPTYENPLYLWTPCMFGQQSKSLLLFVLLLWLCSYSY